MFWRLILLAILAGVAATAAIAWAFQDKIAQFSLNPRAPYQTYTPPAAPDYDDPASWALWPTDPGSGDTDVFYIHSTTYAARDHWNGPIDDTAAISAIARIAAPNEAGPFLRTGAVYGPYYRQATLFSSFTHKFEGVAARELAYQDVKRAFTQFLKVRDADKPFMIAGYGEGGLHALGLLQHVVAKDAELLDRLAVAYVIGVSTPAALFAGPLAAIPPCRYPSDSRCVVAYVPLPPDQEPERFRFRQRALVWTDDERLQSVARPKLLCVNPVLGGQSAAASNPSEHRGAASATGLRLTETPPAIKSAVTAQCQDGVLTVSKPDQAFLNTARWFGAQWRPQPYNIFYHDLVADARRRLHNQKLKEIAQDHAQNSDFNVENRLGVHAPPR